MPSCKMNPNSVKLELVTLIVFTVLLIATTVVQRLPAIGYDLLGLPLAIIAAAFGIPAAKLPHHRAYAIAASIFAVLSALSFIVTFCFTIYSLSLDTFHLTNAYAEIYTAFNIMICITIAIMMFCTAITCALSVKTIQTAIYHKRNTEDLESILASRGPIVVLPPSDNSYLKMPPPLPIGREVTMDMDDQPPPYVLEAEKH